MTHPYQLAALKQADLHLPLLAASRGGIHYTPAVSVAHGHEWIRFTVDTDRWYEAWCYPNGNTQYGIDCTNAPTLPDPARTAIRATIEAALATMPDDNPYRQAYERATAELAGH